MRVPTINSNKNNIPNTMNSQNNVTFGSCQPKTLATKVMDSLEFEKFNFSNLGLCGICYLAVLVPRYIKARDNDEKREILVRDFATITTIIFARRAVQNVVSTIASRKTGFVLNSKPSNHKGILKKIFDYVRPNKGVHALSSGQIRECYSNVHQYKNGVADFAHFITSEGGDVKKVLTSDKKLGSMVQDAYGSWKNKTLKTRKFEEATSTDLTKMFEDFAENKQKGKSNKYIKQIENFFKNPDNALVQKAKSMNSTFDFLTTFGFVPAVLGIFLPYFNEQTTKKLHNANKK